MRNYKIGKRDAQIYASLENHAHDFHAFLVSKKKRGTDIGCIAFKKNKHCPADFIKENALERFPSIRSKEYEEIADYRRQNIQLWNGYLSLKRNKNKRDSDRTAIKKFEKLQSEIRPNVHFKHPVDDIMNFVDSHIDKTVESSVPRSEVRRVVHKVLSHILTTDEFYKFALARKGQAAKQTAMTIIGNNIASSLIEKDEQ